MWFQNFIAAPRRQIEGRWGVRWKHRTHLKQTFRHHSTLCSPNQLDVNCQAKISRLIFMQVRPDIAIRDVARHAAREFQLLQDHLEACRFCWGCGREEAITSTHEVGIHSHCEIHMLMRLREGGASRRKPREQVEFNQEPCHIRRGLHLLCPPTCRCGNSLQGVEEQTEEI